MTICLESDDTVARVTLNRPERRNAIDGRMATELREAFEGLACEQSIRAVVLAAAGSVFCAGADIQWMQSASPVSKSQAEGDAHSLTLMFRAIDECPCPVIARVQGPAFGGGLGLMAVCDMVVASEDATFSLSEARLGLIPAVIAPYLLRKAGESFLRRYALSGDLFTASSAGRFGLAHEVVRQDGLDDRVAGLLEAILRLGPRAVRDSKALIHNLRQPSLDGIQAICVAANARARCASEAQEGLKAFVEKRPPSWASPAAQQEMKAQDAASRPT
jgi:methylglutaconyl-CoA hydratase